MTRSDTIGHTCRARLRARSAFLLATLALLAVGSGIGQDHRLPVPYFGAFHEAPLSTIRPSGWLDEYLVRQRDGLTGHLEAAGHPFNSTGWFGTSMEKYGWVVYEQNAYWVDGMMRCGELLRDSMLEAKASKEIDYVLDHADPDGYLGPKFLKPHSDLSRWPHVVFFRAMMARYGATGDRRIVEALRRHYLSKSDAYTSHRNVVNVEIMLWTYARTRDPELLRLAEECYAGYNRISSEVTTLDHMKSDGKMDGFHGVTFNETAKLAAVLYLYTGKKEYLDAVEHAYQKIDRWYMLVDGVHSSTEGFRGDDPLQSHETCDIADYTWALGYLLMATGKAEYADKIERACYNAATGAITKDFKALQYFSCPNQVIADRTSNHNEFTHGSAWMSFRPNPGTECCAGNVNRIMPDFASRMWMVDSTGEPVAALFGPSVFAGKADGDSITIREETKYPFDDKIQFSVSARKQAHVSLTLRIPSWCSSPRIVVEHHGTSRELRPGSGTFERIGDLENGDVVVSTFPMTLKATGWPEGGVALERGPLVFALPVPHKQFVDTLDTRSTRSFPAWNMEPTGPWNYALAIPDGDLDRCIEVVHHNVNGYPWDEANAPVSLRVPARLVRNWRLDQDPHVAEARYTPHLPSRSTLPSRISTTLDTITLVPYGCTELRMSIFPLDGNFRMVTGREPEPESVVNGTYGEDSTRVGFHRELPASIIHYTLDGTEPTEESPVYTSPILLDHSATVNARGYAPGAEPSFKTTASVIVLHRLPAVDIVSHSPGLSVSYYEGSWDAIPKFSTLSPASKGSSSTLDLGAFSHRDENWGAVFDGIVDVPLSGCYEFFLTSDDGSRLLIDGTTIVDNDGPHSARERNGYALLDKGKHRVELLFYQGTGGMALSVEVTPPGMQRGAVPASWLWHN
ncbi:MAG TPA: beta-L-arabinofuranosidase domain-containing protein [Bacteroidota bacterium]|nr:beta-L-arabinofuranosidase domain-containing protein [Bacteroidota bacterium]